MKQKINHVNDALQGQIEDCERFAIFRFSCKLGRGMKARIKSSGCNWNVAFHGWLCPISKQEAVQRAIENSNLHYDIQSLTLPKGAITTDSGIASRQTRLDILEEYLYKENRQLLHDVYVYNKDLRPEDFVEPPIPNEDSSYKFQVEQDFHERKMDLQKKKEEIEQIRTELSCLDADPSEKIFDSGAPLLIADALIEEHFMFDGNRTLQFCSDVFLHWDGKKYVEVHQNEIRQKIYHFLRDAKTIDDGLLENFNPTKFKVDQVVDALRAICNQKHHPVNGAIWLDGRKGPDPQYIISFDNGLLDVEQWLKNRDTTLMPHTPLLLNVNSLTFDFDPNAPEPSEWLKFLDDIWSDDLECQHTFQEWVGYLLTQNTRQHKILLILGPPRSGKGTIGRVLVDLLGAFNVAGPTLSSLGGEFGLQPLLNKTLAVVSDARLNGKGNNSVILERLLSISGEDPLTINRKFFSAITTQLTTRIIMMSNELPDIRDSSGALVNRYLILRMTKSWIGREDTALLFRLRAELPGILLWALTGLSRLQQRGKFIQPISSTQTIEELIAMTSPIKAFVAEKCDVKAGGVVQIKMLYDAWCVWCNNNGHAYAGNIQTFGKNLQAALPSIETIKQQVGGVRERYYKGIVIL